LAERVLRVEYIPPFIGVDGGDLWIFEDIGAHGAESYDLKALRFYDSRGHKLVATANGYTVTLEMDPQSLAEPETLESLIRTYLSRMSPPNSDHSPQHESATLSELVEMLRKFQKPRMTRHPKGDAR
jgi:hypothetical protein